MTSNRANYCTKTEDREIIQNQSGVSNPSWFKPKLVLTHKTPQQQPQLPQVLASSRASPVSSRGSQAKKHIFVVYDGQYMILNNIWLNIYIYTSNQLWTWWKGFYIRRFTAHFMIKIQRCNESMWIFSPQKLDFSILPWEWGAPGWAHLMIFDVWYVVFRF